MSSASARPQPAECVTQIAWASHSPRAAALSPSSGKPSGVNDIRPLKARAISTSRSAGSIRPASARAEAKSSAVKASSAGRSGSARRGSWR